MEEAMQLYQLAQPEIAPFTIYQIGRAANAMVFIGTILDFIPYIFPFFPPRIRKSTGNTYFCWQWFSHTYLRLIN